MIVGNGYCDNDARAQLSGRDMRSAGDDKCPTYARFIDGRANKDSLRILLLTVSLRQLRTFVFI